jgi:hypothetical protein
VDGWAPGSISQMKSPCQMLGLAEVETMSCVSSWPTLPLRCSKSWCVLVPRRPATSEAFSLRQRRGALLGALSMPWTSSRALAWSEPPCSPFSTFLAALTKLR